MLLALALPVAVDYTRRPDFGFSVHRLTIVSVDARGPAARSGLVPGDVIIALDGQAVMHMHEYYATRASHPDGSPLRVRVQRAGGGQFETAVTAVRLRQGELIHGYSIWVAGLGFLLIGWWVLHRRYDPVARNFFVLCLIFAFFLLDIPDHGNHTYMRTKDTLRTLLQLLLPAYFLRFFLLFPSPRLRPGGQPTRYRALLVAPWLLFALMVSLDAAGFSAAGGAAERVLEIASTVYALGCFLAGLLIFGRRVTRQDRPIQQTKLKVVLVGLLCGLVPFLSAFVIANLQPGSSLPHWQYLALSLLLVPTTFALAILRYGALDTGFVVRIGLVYGLLTLLVLLGYFLIVGLVGNVMAGIFKVDTWPVMILTAAASGLAIIPLRRVVQGWIDRTFYPGRQTNREAVNRLAEGLTGLIDPADVVRVLLDNLNALFHPRSLALFQLVETPQPGFRPVRPGPEAAGPGPGPEPTASAPDFLPLGSDLAHLLNRLRRPVFREEIEDHILAEDADPATLHLLAKLDAALVLPLITGNRLIAFLAFGPKPGRSLYSQDDLANLRVLAVQAASLLESRRLYQSGLARKRLETELEVARDLQRNLLPAATLAAPGFSILGRNEACRMVGGDYFDYFMLASGDLCFAIADVSGKGIPAALMMTSVRTAFRQEARPGLSPAAVAARLNGIVIALGSEGFFTCFFCGIWNPSNGLLRFCNAGMEQPVLFRPGAAFRQVLRKGGPVLGVAPEAHYREGTIQLQPHDRLFLYTDGLTEERDEEGNFFDSARLLDLVAGHLADPPDALLGKVFAAVDAFGGEESSDDRTAIILEINQLQV